MNALERKTLDYWTLSLQYHTGKGRITVERGIGTLRGIVTTTSPQRPLYKRAEKIYGDIIVGPISSNNRSLKP